MNNFLIIVVISLQIFSTFQVKKTRIRSKFVYNSLNCSTSGKTLARENFTCFIEKTKQGTNLIVDVTFIKPVFDVKSRVAILHQSDYEKNYRTLMNTTNNSCAFLNGTSKNPVGNWIVKQLSNSALNLQQIHPCPYYGHVKFNFSRRPDEGGTLFMLKGKYLLTWKLLNDDDSNVAEFKLDGILM